MARSAQGARRRDEARAAAGNAQAALAVAQRSLSARISTSLATDSGDARAGAPSASPPPLTRPPQKQQPILMRADLPSRK